MASPDVSPKRRVLNGRTAFTLVELTLAIGIIAFAFVALFGLLPAGLNVFREAMDTSVTSQISQRVAAELQSTDFHTLMKRAALDGEAADPETQDRPAHGVLPRRYFDDQGNEVRITGEEPSDAERLQILYEVNVRLTRSQQLSSGAPGSEVTSLIGSRNMATALIQIASNPEGKPVPLDGATMLLDVGLRKIPIQSYPAVISRNGSEARRTP